MSNEAFVIHDPAQPHWLVERTRRSVARAGVSLINDPATSSSDGLWLIRAGAWTARESIALPVSDKPLALIGATLKLPANPGDITPPNESWSRALQHTGGDLQHHFDGLPDIDSLWLNAAAMGQVTDWSLPFNQLLQPGWRIVRHSALDVFSDARMRVLEIITSLQRGGAERVALDLNRELVRQGVASRLCALGSPTRQPFDVPEQVVSLARLPFDSVARAEGIAATAHALGIDVLHGHLIEAATAEWLTERGWPLVLTVHNERPGWPVGFDQLRPNDRLLLAACSKAVESDVATALPTARVRTVWNGIDANMYRPTKRAVGDVITLIAVANPRPQKRLFMLAEVLAALRSTGCNARLVLAGEPSAIHASAQEELDRLWAQARALGVDSHLHFAGAVMDVAGLLDTADVFVSTSAFEGLSLAQLEALATGLPVVATDVGGAREVAEMQPAVTLVPVDASPTAFAEAILASLKKRGGHLAPDFTTPVMAARYRWLFHALLAKSQRPKRGLLLVTNNFSTGGAQSSARRLLTGLRDAGEQVSAAVLQEWPDHPTPGREVLIKSGIPVLAMPPPDVCEAASALVPLLQAIVVDPPESVVFWNVIPEYKLLIADALWDTPVFEVSPGEMLFASLDRYFGKPRPGLPYQTSVDYGRQLAGIVVKYQAEASIAAKSYDRPVHVISNGVSIAEIVRVPSPGPVIGTAARLHPHKRLDDLIEAFRLVHAKRPDVTLLIAGGEEQGFESYAQQLRGSAHDLPIEWLGDLRDVAAFHRRIDIFAMISEPSGCPNASLEAMAAGLPVVATAVGGAVDQIVDGECGYLTPPQDAEPLAERLLLLIEDPELRLKMGSAARRRIEQHFSLDQMVSEYRRVCLGR